MTNYTELKNLYLLCFTDDTEEDAEILFKNVLSKAKSILEYNEKGKPIAMLFLMDANIIVDGNPLPYYYLYAACTRPDYRKKGIMGKLLDKAKKEAIANEKEGIFLKPANKSLFNFYARYDFKPYFKICKINTSIKNFTKLFNTGSACTSKVSLDEWCSLRKSFLSKLSNGYVDFSKDILTTAADGSIAINSQNFGFVYEKRDDLLLVKEAICEKGYTNELFNAISQIAKTFDVSEIEIRIPVALNNEIEHFDDLIQDFSVMWLTPNTQKLNPANFYHGFAFD